MERGNFEGERGGPLQSIGNTIHERLRYGLLSDYFDHLLYVVIVIYCLLPFLVVHLTDMNSQVYLRIHCLLYHCLAVHGIQHHIH